MSAVPVVLLFLVSFFPHPEMGDSSESPNTDLKAADSSPLPQEWLTSFQQAKKLAVRNRKPLLLHFDATWCGACRRMDAEVLNRPEVTALLGTSVVGVKIDADRYKNLIAEFEISSLPTEVVVMADGTQGTRYTGAVSLSTYVARLRTISDQHDAVVAKAESKPSTTSKESKSTRSCLIVKRDGKMVGLGGYSPVALSNGRQWKKGSDKLVAVHEGVDYFFQTGEELAKFKAAPASFIPKLHGCDPVALFQDNEATIGAIEYGAFYRGKVFFFASVENRSRFENNPGWYSKVSADAFTENDDRYPFLNGKAMDN